MDPRHLYAACGAGVCRLVCVARGGLLPIAPYQHLLFEILTLVFVKSPNHFIARFYDVDRIETS